MNKSLGLLFLFCITQLLQAQNVTTNKGTEFWVGYGHHQYMETSTDNSQNMTIYLSVESLPLGVSYATVTVSMPNSGNAVGADWQRVYHIPANTVISIANSATPAFSSGTGALTWGPVPKGSVNAGISNTPTMFDARLYSSANSTGVFSGKAIHIESDYPIVAYSHIYGGVSSGATMLLPVNTWGTRYTTINSQQWGANSSYNFVYAIAAADNTPVIIKPSQQLRNGTAANTTITTILNKGQVYQILGYADASGNGVQLTGTTVASLDPTKPIAVFAGSSRTAGENISCATGSRDNDMQQCYPMENWGTSFLTTAFAAASTGSITPAIYTQCVYKIIAHDAGTMVSINGTAPVAVPLAGYYQFSSGSACRVESNKPIMLGQFMVGGNCTTGLGDPEMIYLSPTERGVTYAGFYRNTKENIEVNYVSLIVPKDGLSSLTIDGQNTPFGTYSNIKLHPADSNYYLVTKGWPAAQSQCIVKCDKKFTGITYGLGGAESYGYNIGANFFLGTPYTGTGSQVKIGGLVYCDANGNNVYDSSETIYSNVKVQLGFGSNVYTLTNTGGVYQLAVDSLPAGTYQLVAVNGVDTLIKSFTLATTIKDTSIFQFISLCPSGPATTSFDISVGPLATYAIAGQPYPYWVQYQNTGNVIIPNAAIQVNYNNYLLAYDSCTDASVVPTATGFVKAVTNLLPNQVGQFVTYMTIKPSANNGDTLTTTYSMTGSGLSMADSFYNIIQNNNSSTAMGGRPAISPAQVTAGKSIDYTLNFRNTYTYTVNKVRITDTLGSLLDAGTIKVLASSSAVKTTVKGNIVTFEMATANLTNPSANYLKSLGFIKYSVKPKSTVVIGDVITNTANVYYDFDNPISTNTVNTIVNSTGIITPLSFVSYTAALNENAISKEVINKWQTVNEVNVANYTVQRSFDGRSFTSIATINAKNNKENEYVFIDKTTELAKTLSPVVYYRIIATDKGGRKTHSAIQQINIKPQTPNNVFIFPNPAKDYLFVQSRNTQHVYIINYSGIVVKEAAINNKDLFEVNIKSLARGVYVIKVVDVYGAIQNRKLIIN